MQTTKSVKNQPFALPVIEHYPQNPLRFRINFNGLPTGVTPSAELVETRSGRAYPEAYQPEISFADNSLSGLFAANQLTRFGNGATVEFSWSGEIKMTLGIAIDRDPVAQPPAEGVFNVEVNEAGLVVDVNFQEAGFAQDAKTYRDETQAMRDEVAEAETRINATEGRINNAETGLPAKVDKEAGKALALITELQKLAGLPTAAGLTTLFAGKENTGIAAGLVTSLQGGNTTDTLATLRANINTLNALVGSATPDADSVINMLIEVFNFLANVPEGVELLQLLNSKVDVSAVVNSLTTVAAGSVLDARQGKALKDLIDALTTAYTAHTNNTSNPHNVTAAQVGAYTRVPVANYATALAQATGSTPKIFIVAADETDSGNTNYYYYEGTAGVLTLQF